VLHRADGSVGMATQRAGELLAVDPRELEGVMFGTDGPSFEAADGAVLHAEELPCMQALRTGETCTAVVRLRGADGRERWLELESKLLDDLPGRAYAVATTIVDVTQQREREHHLSHDEVTGLDGRVVAIEHLRRAIARAARRRAALTVLFVDLDDFKKVNDAFGHWAGDRVLRTFASRLRGAVRAADMVGRIGGDEFLVVAGDFEPAAGRAAPASEVATNVARAIARRITATLEEPLSDGERSHRLAASMGVAVYPDHGEEVESLLRSADEAMYEAKAAGRGCVRFYTPPAGEPTPTQNG
jgi:diguanylate cyclase (GGDEF)-like protein